MSKQAGFLSFLSSTVREPLVSVCPSVGFPQIPFKRLIFYPFSFQFINYSFIDASLLMLLFLCKNINNTKLMSEHIKVLFFGEAVKSARCLRLYKSSLFILGHFLISFIRSHIRLLPLFVFLKAMSG